MRIFVLGTLMFGSTGLLALPYRLVEIEPPNALVSRARDINERGVVLGNYAQGTNTYAFLWDNGQLTIVDGPGMNALGLALNNHDEFVGVFNPPPRIRPDGLAEWRTQAWKHSGGTNVLLAESVLEGSEAWGINDAGEVVGSIGRPNTINGHRAAVLSPSVIPLSFYQGGLAGPPEEHLVGINNSGAIAGYVDNRGYRWTSSSPVHSEYLDRAVLVSAINSAGQIVGEGGLKLSVNQPGVWDGTNVTWLGAPLAASGSASDISDNGIIVGKYYRSFILFGTQPSGAMLWTNGLGIELDSLVILPPGQFLGEAVAVNSKGWIAANAHNGDKIRAVLLVPDEAPVSLPKIDLTEPASGFTATNEIHARLKVAESAASIRRVEFHLHRRYLQPSVGGGDFYQPARWQSYAVRIHTLLQSPFTTTFPELPAGQYAVNAFVETDTGVRVHTVPIFVTVTGPTALEAMRLNFRGEFQYGFNGQAGALYGLEQSSDLVHWRPVNEPPSTSGGGFTTTATNDLQRFFRTRVLSRDAEYFGAAIPSIAPPQGLAGAHFLFSDYQNQPVYDIQFDTATVAITFGDGEARIVPYAYSVSRGRGEVSIEAEALKIGLELEWSWEMNPRDWRGVQIKNGVREEFAGRF